MDIVILLEIFLNCYRFEKFFFVLLHSSFYSIIYQVAIEVEREEDEGGTAGETFTDYVSILLLKFS